MKRKLAIDYEKGLIVAVMVLCHVLQYFGQPDKYPEQRWIILSICAMAFSTFTFAYGRSVYLAYLTRSWWEAAPKMLGSVARSYGAFCISGIAYNLICANKLFTKSTLINVILLRDIPGMSEFLASFAMLGLVSLILFPLLKRLAEHRALCGVAALCCFASAFIPYGSIRDPRLGLLIGSKRFYLFPVLQYMPFFLSGLYVGRNGMKPKALWLGVSFALTGAGVVNFIVNGEPGRFPPELMWLVLPCAAIVLLNMLAEVADGWTQNCRWGSRLLAPVASMGRNSLYYLLTSNLIIFSVSRMGTLPVTTATQPFPFNLPLHSTPWALFWTLVMLLGIAFVGGLYRKAGKR